MNKKLLFAAVSLAALTACSTDDFESQNIAAEKTSPVQFEVINNNDSFTRAYMDGSNIHWQASKGDLFTLYHGGEATGTPVTLTKYQNATYTAVEGAGAATLTTPSMIKEGYALMIWPVDTAFTNKGTDAVAISIPETLDNIENNITYASDLVQIKEREGAGYKIGADNTAGYNRKYPVYMRPLTSQLTLKADYAGTEEAIKALYEGADPIDPIKVTSVDLTNTTETFTQKIALNFTAAEAADRTRWGGDDRDNTWSHKTGFAATASESVAKLTTKVLTGNESAKFLILPKSTVGEDTDNPAVVVNTTYGKVATTSYLPAELNKAWYKTKGDEKSVKVGMKDVFDAIDIATVKANTVVKGEPVGASATRYVKVLLKYIDMDELHVTSDKQLYDAVRVWKELGLDNKDPEKHTITVYLDGDKGEFKISQKTIAKINELNAAAANEETSRSFQVMPCKKAGEACNTIVITDGGTIAQDLSFIVENPEGGEDKKAAVALNAGKEWKWNSKNVTVAATATGIKSIINRGTLVSDANATLKIMNNATPATQVTDITFENNGTWNINAGVLYVQFDVTNYGTVNIAKGAEYLQSKTNNVFTNEATTLPERFFMNDPSKKPAEKKAFKEQIGVVNNKGVFAAVSGATINNYGLIEHADVDAKTMITANQTTGAPFEAAFNDKATMDGTDNKMGRINLPYSNKDEADISISASAASGFVSVTVTSDNAPADKKLNATAVGLNVNYVIINSGIKEITDVSAQVKYIEFNDKDNTEITWKPRYNVNKDTGVKTKVPYEYDGLVVFSPVNIELNAIVNVKQSVYIAASMYVSGELKYNNAAVAEALWNGYFGTTKDNAATMYKTFGSAED